MKRFGCDRLRRHLRGASLADGLPDAMTEHLTVCPACQEEWNRQALAFRRLTEDVGQIGNPPPLDLAHQAELIRRLRDVSDTRRRRTPKSRTLRRLAPALVASLSLIGWGVVAHRSSRHANSIASSRIAKRSDERLNGHDKIYPRIAAVPNVSKLSVSNGLRDDAHPKTVKKLKVSPQSAPNQAKRAAIQNAKTDDLAYINEPVPSERMIKSNRIALKGKNHGDDFVTIPLPEIAASPSAATNHLIAEAAAQYEKEKAVVDDRLARKIDIEMKGGELKELMGLLTRETGVRFYVRSDIENWKLSVFMDRTPVRDLMRQIARLFDLEWRRRGEDGKYTYELIQTLKAKLAEEELRRKDEDQMLLNVIDEIEPYRQYVDAPKEQIEAQLRDAKARMETAGSVEEREEWRKRLQMFNQLSTDRFRSSVRFFAGLTPGQLVDLRNGKELRLSFNEGDDTMDPETADRLRSEVLHLPGFRDNDFCQRLSAMPSDQVGARVTLFLKRDRPDQVNLVSDWTFTDKESGVYSCERGWLTAGQPDRLRNPDNRAAHAALRSSPDYRKTVSVAPGPATVPTEKVGTTAVNMLESLQVKTSVSLPRDRREWIDSADYLTELHRKTGRNLIADYYTRVYPRSSFAVAGVPLLTALNEAADALKSDWSADGSFIRLRRFDYYTEREIDIPNAWLRRWQADSEKRGYLSLDSLAEMTAFPKAVLLDKDLELALLVKYGLNEYPIVNMMVRDVLQLYAKLDAQGRWDAQSAEGVPLVKLIGKDEAAVLGLFGRREPFAPDQIASGRFHIRLRTPGRYTWTDVHGRREGSVFPVTEAVDEAVRADAEREVARIGAARGLTPAQVAENRQRIKGPEASLYTQAQAGDDVFIHDVGPFGGFDWNGSISQGIP